VSVIAPDYKKQGATVIPAELKYVEVISVTASSGYDANTGEMPAEEDERELPSTVTLLVSPEQSKVLAELEADGKPHLSLIYRGTPVNAAKFTAVQDQVIAELYPPAVADNSQETEDSEDSGQAVSAESEAE
jgi:pilus assembly protein CpaB